MAAVGRAATPVELVLEQAAEREPELVPIRHGRMLASPFAFFRGTAALMAGDLAQTPQSGITVQLCGDAHLSNFGGFAAPDRELVFDMNDFDETARGPWEWDVKRLSTSIAIAGRELGLTAAQRQQAVEAAVRSYREAMREFAALRNLELWYSRLDVARLLSHAGDQVSRRERTAFKRRIAGASAKDHLRAMSKLTARVDGQLRIVPRPPQIVPIEELFPATTSEAVEVEMRTMLRAYRRSLPVERRHLLESYRYRHMARRVGGDRQRRNAHLDRPAHRTRRRRPAVPPGQGGRALGARAVHGPQYGAQSRPARRPGPAADAGRRRHLPRLAARRGH